MPRERFINLPQEKKDRIINATIQELSRVGFDELSINKIIQTAGIPRGSFYQYFENKQDLLDFIMQDYKQMMIKGIKEVLQETNGDVFAVFQRALHDTICFGTKKENYDFCRNIFSQIKLREGFSFEIFHTNAQELIDRFIPYINIDMFKYKDKENLRDIVEILIALIRSSIAKVFYDVSEKDTVQKSFENKLNMLRHGILENGE